MPTRILTAVLLALGLTIGAGIAPAFAVGMQVTVTTPTGTSVILNVESDDSIENVRQKIRDELTTPPEQQLLFFGSTRLEDGQTLADYGVGDGATIRLAYVPASGLGMQVFVRNPSGSSFITLDVYLSDSTENIKTKIENTLGYLPSNQRVYYNGTLMLDGYTLGDYNVQNESTLELIVTAPGALQIVVRVLSTGRLYAIDIDYSDSIENVKTKVQDRTGFPPSQQQLYFAGRLLEDNRTLADYNIQNYNMVTLVAAVPLTWTDATIASFVLGADYADAVAAARQLALPTYAVSAGSLPAGIILDPDGTLSGRPTTVGPYSFTITASRDDGLTIDQAFSGRIGAAAVTAALAATGDDSIPPLALAGLILLLGVALKVRRRA